jgi:hypothetical protein
MYIFLRKRQSIMLTFLHHQYLASILRVLAKNYEQA